MTIHEKVVALLDMKRYFFCLFVTYLCSGLMTSGLMPARGSAEDFTWVWFFHKLGSFLGRATTHWIPIPLLEFFPVGQIAALIVMTFDGFYLFLTIVTMCALQVWTGSLIGAVYSNCFVVMRKKIVGDDREFSLAVGSSFNPAGSILASALSIPIQDFLMDYHGSSSSSM